MILRWHPKVVVHPQIAPVITTLRSFRRHQDASLQLDARHSAFPVLRRLAVGIVFAILEGLPMQITDYSQEQGATRR
jgi:hypothetical protein